MHHGDVVNNLPYLVTEYIEGATLRQVLNCSGSLFMGTATYAARQIAEAVEALHDANIVHRDIKPSNVLIDKSGAVFVTDFGLSITRSAASPGPLVAGAAGTPIYMAPESFDGEASPRTDVYALGIMFFELLTGTPPYIADTPEKLKREHKRTPLPLDTLPSELVSTGIGEILERATYKDAVYRYKTAGKLRKALASISCPETQVTAGRLDLAQALATSCRETTADPAARSGASSNYYETMNARASERQAARPAPQSRPQEKIQRIETAVEMFLREERRISPSYDEYSLILSMIGLGLPVGLVYFLKRFFPTIPLWTLVLGILLLVSPLILLAFGKRRTARARYQPGQCLDCGYDLTGNESDTCPECGVDRNDATRLRRCPHCKRRYRRDALTRVCRRCGFDPSPVLPRKI